jgi:hypothetical protein
VQQRCCLATKGSLSFSVRLLFANATAYNPARLNTNVAEAVWRYQASDTSPAERRSTRARRSLSRGQEQASRHCRSLGAAVQHQPFQPFAAAFRRDRPGHHRPAGSVCGRGQALGLGVDQTKPSGRRERSRTHQRQGQACRWKTENCFRSRLRRAVFLLTRGGTGMQAGQRIKVRGVPVFGLGEWRDLVDAEGAARLSPEQIERAALLLEPAARVALTGDLRSFAGLINLERLPTPDAPFHRVYRGQHPTRRDKVILHLYDLSATDEKDAENRARREYEVMQHWQKSPYLPNLLDSFQEAERYPGELYWFSLVDPAAPPLTERTKDHKLESRRPFALRARSALGSGRISSACRPRAAAYPSSPHHATHLAGPSQRLPSVYGFQPGPP